jgi:hypothetical protein
MCFANPGESLTEVERIAARLDDRRHNSTQAASIGDKLLVLAHKDSPRESVCLSCEC